MKLLLTCKQALVTPCNAEQVEVFLDGFELDDLLRITDPYDIVKHYNTGKLLDAIGEVEAMDHFDLIRKDGQISTPPLTNVNE